MILELPVMKLKVNRKKNRSRARLDRTEFSFKIYKFPNLINYLWYEKGIKDQFKIMKRISKINTLKVLRTLTQQTKD